ncbi:HD-GYP domain-containing protein [Pseudorhodoferax sp.]|uniref:HD-GYP domain-containing protein n=1 Tax=Pseudorhodoferax sp. TaxID=1993553 RepID=UPI002DD662C0|nr:HD-GYP domain-containing protein [Pseudorhodoferax sp.]
MIKKIPARQLRIGMYVHEFCGSWMDHPFWRARFKVRNEAELQRIVSGGIGELWIDTAKGLDVEGPASDSVDRATVDAEVERRLELLATMPAPLAPMEAPGNAFDAAAALVRRSVPQIASMFREARMGHAVDLGASAQMVDEISSSVADNPGALISVVRIKNHDEYTYMHSMAVSALMVALGRQMGLSPNLLKRAAMAGLLHDLGKAKVPLAILNKPGKLTEAEFALMKAHPQLGHAMLLRSEGAGPVVLDVCLHHHEKFDGSGYPDGLAGDKISMLAKMGTVCDVYDAITSERPYNKGWDPGEALRRMAQWRGHFDPAVFQAFVRTVGIYPVGSLLRLHSGVLAVVVQQNPAQPMAPKVKVFYSPRARRRIEPYELDLASPQVEDKVLGCESPQDWGFTDLDRLWGAPAG